MLGSNLIPKRASSDSNNGDCGFTGSGSGSSSSSISSKGEASSVSSSSITSVGSSLALLGSGEGSETPTFEAIGSELSIVLQVLMLK